MSSSGSRAAGSDESIAQQIARLRASFRSGHTRPVEWRRSQLRALKNMLETEEERICAALWSDLRKSKFEAAVTEYGTVLSEIELALAQLEAWSRDDRVSIPLKLQPGRAWKQSEPLGVVLIIGAWNYPVNLLLTPLVGALAAGNAVVLKPSEIALHTSALMAELISQYLDLDGITVIEGGAAEVGEILNEKLDLIFFTGSAAVARIIMERAARHLTPVVLELGGKCPCLIDETANLQVAAKRIVWGKFLNAGQTCVAPDYLLAHETIHDELLELLQTTIVRFFGDDPQKSPDYCRIVSDRRMARLAQLLGSGEIVCGGTVDALDRYIAPTILRSVPLDADIMTEEIFGPLLPVFPFRDVAAAIDFVNDRPKPLALYVFSNSRETQSRILDSTSSGNACVNTVVLHLAAPALPFGGVGESGTGRYHGKFGFDTFSHEKGVLEKSTRFDLPILYPPYTESNLRMISFLP